MGSIILFLIVSGVIFCEIKYFYKKTKTVIDIVLLILYSSILVTPIIIYFMDALDIPTKLFSTQNINTQNWLGFLANYTSSIVSAIIGSLVSLSIMLYQIDRTNKDSEKRDKENLRIQNMPILKYTLDSENVISYPDKNLIETKIDSKKHYYLTVIMKNVGLNNIKNLKVQISIKELNIVEYIYGNDSLELLEKNESLSIEKGFELEGNDKKYNIELKMEYKDLLENRYEQMINIKYVATNRKLNGFNYYGKINYTVKEERIVV